MDATVFPAAAEYLAALPGGEDSYPQCQIKGSVLRGLIDSTPVPFPASQLPPRFRALVDSPPLPNAWMPEVLFNALMLAHEDRIEQKAFRDWVYKRNRQLLSSSLYRVLFLVISPERMFAGMTHRWNVFRRGSELVMLSGQPHLVRVELRYPPHLHQQRTLGNLAIAVSAACDAAGGKSSRARLELVEPRRARVEIAWD